jgi:hypothetical protein
MPPSTLMPSTLMPPLSYSSTITMMPALSYMTYQTAGPAWPFGNFSTIVDPYNPGADGARLRKRQQPAPEPQLPPKPGQRQYDFGDE